MIDITSAIPNEFKMSITSALGTNSWRLVKFSDAYTDKIGGYKYSLILDVSNTVIASWELLQMIHCCGICVSTSSYVHKDYQRKGLGSILNNLRIILATKMGYGCLMCTDIESNEPQRKILKKNGWKDIHSFTNPRTKNKVFISVIDLNK